MKIEESHFSPDTQSPESMIAHFLKTTGCSVLTCQKIDGIKNKIRQYIGSIYQRWRFNILLYPNFNTLDIYNGSRLEDLIPIV